MRSRLTILLLVAATALSCAREKVEKSSDGKESKIGFAMLLTRGGTVINPASLADAGGFDVWAYSHTTPWPATPTATLIDGQQVNGSVNGSVVSWSYDNPVMWPDEYVSFFAYGPSGSATPTGTFTADGVPIISFTANSSASAQADLVMAAPVYNRAGTTYAYNPVVSLAFSHVLSKISFSGIMSDPTDTRIIKMSKIVMNDILTSGTAPVVYNSSSSPVEWTLGSAKANYTVAAATGELDGTVALSTTSVDVTTSDGYMFLLPQTMARENGEDPTMDITLSISEDGGLTFDEVTYASVVFSPEAWVAGKSYNYQIIVDKDDLRIIRIEIDTELTPWNPTIVLQTIYLTSDVAVDESNLETALNTLSTVNSLSVTHTYYYYGLYAVNDVNHNITINIGDLTTDGYIYGYQTGQYLIFDLKKLVRSWGYDTDPTDPWLVEVVNYSSGWELASAMQTIPASYDVDGVTSATLPATLPKNGGGTVNVPVADNISALGSIILKKR